MRRQKRNRGTSLTEAIVAGIIIVPVALFLLDLSVLVIANSINDKAVKNAARAAANHDTPQFPFDACQKSLASFKSSPIVSSLEIKDLKYLPNPPDRCVVCVTRMQVKLPIPFPGFSTMTFVASATEPIVAGKAN